MASEASAISQCLQPWRDQIAKIGLAAGPMSEWLTAGLEELGLSIGVENLPYRNTENDLGVLGIVLVPAVVQGLARAGRATDETRRTWKPASCKR